MKQYTTKQISELTSYGPNAIPVCQFCRSEKGILNNATSCSKLFWNYDKYFIICTYTNIPIVSSYRSQSAQNEQKHRKWNGKKGRKRKKVRTREREIRRDRERAKQTMFKRKVKARNHISFALVSFSCVYVRFASPRPSLRQRINCWPCCACARVVLSYVWGCVCVICQYAIQVENEKMGEHT